MAKKTKTARNILIGLLLIGAIGFLFYYGIFNTVFPGTCYEIKEGSAGAYISGLDCATNTEYEYTGQCELDAPGDIPCSGGYCPPDPVWRQKKIGCQGDVCFVIYTNSNSYSSSEKCAYGYCTHGNLYLDECENTQFGQITLEDSQLVVVETFTAGTQLTYDSLRYPALYLMGSQNPMLILDAETNTVSRSANEYARLANGETLTIPDTQVWTLYYVIENNYNLPTICTSVDALTGECATSSIGLVTLCSQGQFDPSLGACVVQPESQYICPEGGRYDTAQAICIINPPLNKVCEVGELTDIGNGNYACIYEPETIELNGTILCIEGDYDSSRDACVVSPNIQYLCLNGDYDLTTNTCKIVPEEKIICANGYDYNEAEDKCIKTPEGQISKNTFLWILLAISILVVGYILLTNKKIKRILKSLKK